MTTSTSAACWAVAALCASNAIEVSAQTVSTGAERLEEIIVTGSVREERRFDVSYAVNSLAQDDVARLAPINFADLLGKLPGLQVEATGGEVQNITRVRGIPTDDGLALFQQDGLPLFHDINGNFFRGDSLNRYDLMNERLEVVRGGPAPIFASQAAAIINNITVTGDETTRGKVQLTLGSDSLYRLDAFQAGPISDKTYYALGGFVRRHDGHRDNGFPNDEGGQIRGNIKHDLDNGSIRLSFNYLNDHNVFYLPIPIADPRNPGVSLNRYIDFFTGTMNSPVFQNANLRYRDAAGVVQNDARDLQDGRHVQYGNLGVQYNADFNGWEVALKTGYTRGELDFDALYSTSNPADAGVFANGFLNSANAAFGSGGANPVARLGYTIAGTSGAQVYDPAAASGLVMQAQYRAVGSEFYSGQSDLSVTKKFYTPLGVHDLRVGTYFSKYGETNSQVYQDYLLEVRGKPRTLDLVAYSGSGAILGYVTDSGVLRYGTTLNGGDVDATAIAIYVNETWEITRNLRVDGGIRHEQYDIDGYGLLTTSANLGDPTTLADDAVRAFTGVTQPHSAKPDVTNWTVGLNYDVTPSFGGYARVSHLEVPPQATSFFGINPVILTTKANQYEVGLKASYGAGYLYVTGFYTKFDPFNASFIAFNPQTGRNDQAVPFVGEAVVTGVEMDGSIHIGPWFSIDGSVTIQDPQYNKLANSSGADPSAVNGNQIIREPKAFGNIRPTLDFDLGDDRLQLYARYDYTGKRYVDLFNQTALPSFGSLSLGAIYTRGAWDMQLVGDNVTNEEGLTEGNTRTDTLSGQGTRNAIYGRPVFGRSVRFIVSKSW